MSIEEIKKLTFEYSTKNRFWNPDKIEVIFIILLAIFTFCTTYNFTLLNLTGYNIPILETLVTQVKGMVFKIIVISCLTYATALFRVISQTAKVYDKAGNFIMIEDTKGNKTPLTLTRINIEGFFSTDSIIETFIVFVICFSVNSFISFVLFRYNLSLFNIATSQLTFAVITAFSEEMLFSFGFQAILMPYLDGLTIPLITIVFVAYHGMVYGGNIPALLFVGIARFVYAVVYYYTRRVSGLCLAHMLNNILAFSNVATGLSIFNFLLPFF